eukprot:scaffold7831_cov108-Isochrysis_galbana.AAC.15
MTHAERADGTRSPPFPRPPSQCSARGIGEGRTSTSISRSPLPLRKPNESREPLKLQLSRLLGTSRGERGALESFADHAPVLPRAHRKGVFPKGDERSTFTSQVEGSEASLARATRLPTAMEPLLVEQQLALVVASSVGLDFTVAPLSQEGARAGNSPVHSRISSREVSTLIPATRSSESPSESAGARTAVGKREMRKASAFRVAKIRRRSRSVACDRADGNLRSERHSRNINHHEWRAAATAAHRYDERGGSRGTARGRPSLCTLHVGDSYRTILSRT